MHFQLSSITCIRFKKHGKFRVFTQLLSCRNTSNRTLRWWGDVGFWQRYLSVYSLFQDFRSEYGSFTLEVLIIEEVQTSWSHHLLVYSWKLHVEDAECRTFQFITQCNLNSSIHSSTWCFSLLLRSWSISSFSDAGCSTAVHYGTAAIYIYETFGGSSHQSISFVITEIGTV